MPQNIAKIFLSFFRQSLYGPFMSGWHISEDWEDDKGSPGFTITLDGKRYEVKVTPLD